MFCKINGKYYVKVSNFYQEVKVEKNNIVPIQGEKNRLYAPIPKCKKVTAQEILEANIKGIDESYKGQKEEIKKIF